MLRNYVLTATRNLVRHRLYGLINIGGLAIGLAACMLIFLFVRDEMSYDQWLPGADNIYRLHSTFKIPGRPVFSSTGSAGGLAWQLPDTLPEVEAFTRLGALSMVAVHGENTFEEDVTFVDQGFFDVFDLPMAAGSQSDAFANGNSVILSERTARKYFGDQQAVGKSLEFCCVRGEPLTYIVTGIFRDIPDNSHLSLDLVAPIVRERFSHANWFLESLTSLNVYTYFRFLPGTDVAATEARIQQLVDEILPIPAGSFPPSIEKASDFYNLSLMPIRDIHLHAKEQAADGGDMRPLGDITNVYAFVAVALLILSIASINFMNLSTARSTLRAREVSLRKVVGAGKLQLVFQFLGESVILTLVAALLSLAVVELTLPTYNAFLGKSLALNFLDTPQVLAALIAAAMVLGLVSGIYPALVLSGFRPARVLKANKASDPEGASGLRSALVVIQFAISVGLVTVTGTIYAQTLFAKNADLGFDRDNKIIVKGIGASAARPQTEALINELRQHPNVAAVAWSSEAPTENRENITGFSVPGSSEQQAQLNYIATGFDFFETYGIAPIYGRTFDRARGGDLLIPDENRETVIHGGIMLNVSAAKRLGFDNPEDALGQIIRSEVFANPAEMEVIGIVPDVKFRSLRYGLQPTVYFNYRNYISRLTIQIRGSSVGEVLPDIQSTWKKHVPSYPFSFEILDDMIEAQYVSEDAEAMMFAAFSVLAALIACMGLFGLSTFSVEQRAKEIGIRKVLGANVAQIVQLLVWQFSKPVLWANLIGIPVAAWFMSDWLRGFEYRIDQINIAYLGLASAVFALLVAWGTVAAHATRVARANPIHALRYE